MSKINFSSAITVSSHTTITEALTTMRTHNTEALLITDYQDSHRLVGIFTEHDLLRWSLDLRKLDQWDQSISNIMTKDPITISITEIDQAPDILASIGKRHLPVTFLGDSGKPELAGVITMKDCFLKWAEEHKSKTIREQEAKLSSFTVTALVKEPRDRALQKSIIGDGLVVQFINDKDIGLVQSADLFIFDLDHYPAAFWSPTLKMVLDQPKHPAVLLVYHPTLHQADELKTIQALSAGKVVQSFLKPIRILEYRDVVRNSLMNHET